MSEKYIWKKGSELTRAEQAEVLNRFVHRFTGEHKPNWAKAIRVDGSVYPVQFANDTEWLANTEFRCYAKSGALDRFYGYCESTPTWPNNPELREQFKQGPYVSGTVTGRGNVPSTTPYGGCP
jgi:hypothetical protein